MTDEVCCFSSIKIECMQAEGQPRQRHGTGRALSLQPVPDMDLRAGQDLDGSCGLQALLKS